LPNIKIDFPESYPDVNTQHGNISLNRFDKPAKEKKQNLVRGKWLGSLRLKRYYNSSDYSSKFSNKNRKKPL